MDVKIDLKATRAENDDKLNLIDGQKIKVDEKDSIRLRDIFLQENKEDICEVNKILSKYTQKLTIIN